MALQDYSFDLLGRRCQATLPVALIPWLRYEYEFGYAIANDYPAIHIEVWQHAFAEPSHTMQEVSVPGQTIAAYAYELEGMAGFLLRLGSSQLFINNDDNRLRYHTNDEPQSLATLIGVGLNELLRRSGWLPFHASVAVKEDKALAFLGPSGRGKSTTLLTSLQHGYKALNEDTCWLPPDSHLLYGWDRGFHLLADAYERFAAMLDGIPYTEISVVSGDKKRLLWRDLLERDLVTRSPVELTHLVWLERPTDFLEHPSAWQTISKQKAALGLWEAIGTTLSSDIGQNIGNRIPQLLKSVACRQLFLGNTTIPFDAIDERLVISD